MIKLKKKLSIINYQLSTSMGFTLIELVVTITIVAILASVGFASFVTYSRSQILEQSAQDLKLAIEKAKYSAFSKVKPSQCTVLSPGNDSLHSYEIEFCASCPTYSYKVSAKCGIPTEYAVVTTTKKLGNNVSLGSITCQKVRFSVLSNKVTCEDGSGVIPSSLTLSAYGNSKSVSIDTIGSISIQ